MNITRNNYEEFFLLYVDGELNIQQQQMVEMFVAENTDLQEELNMLLDTKIVADDVVFDKSSLYKNELTAISSTNYQEKFLLYIDNELNPVEKAEVETYVLQNPATQTSFTLLKNTVLPKETIVCPNKEALYKKEEKPVVFMWVKRLAVAAAILFFAVMVWMLAPNKNATLNPENSVVNNDKRTEKNIQPTVTPKQVEPLNNETTVAVNKQTKQENTKPVNVVLPKDDVKNNMAQQKVENNVSTTIVTTHQQEKPANIATQMQVNNNAIVAINSAKKDEITTSVAAKNNEVATVNPVNNQAASVAAQPAVYRILNTDDDVENNSVLVGNIKVNKTKLNNLFKKAKGLFAKPKKEADTKDTYVSNSNTI